MNELLEMAWIYHDRAYCPYSKFRVGAAIKTTSGKTYGGCNVEVANYGCTLCAERTAIVKAVSEGDLKPGELTTVVVAAKTPKPTAPCGSCRQVIEEFAHPDAMIYMTKERGKIDLKIAHADLLPYSFNGSSLK